MEPTDTDVNQIWGVPNQYAHGQMAGIMQGIDTLVTFPSQTLHQTTMCEDSPGGKTATRLCLVRRKSWLYGRFQRKLINEALDTFLSLQKAAAGSSGPGASFEEDFRPLLIKKSKEYRSIIQACVSEMSRYVDDVSAGRPVPFQEDPDELRAQCQLLYKMELILGIAEIVFISAPPGLVVVPELLTWIRLHFPQCRQRLSEALAEDQPHTYPHYWETVYGLVLQGMTDEARDLLSRHPNSNVQNFLSMDELLRKMPAYTVYAGVSEAEFLTRWHHWHGECQARLDKGDFATCKQLQLICKILCGDQEAFGSLCDVAETWYALMASMILYTNPLTKVYRLSGAAHEALIAFGADQHCGASATHLDRLLLAAFQANDHLVMKECQAALGNLWFSAHLCDLISHASGDQPDKRYLREMREGLLVDLACELGSHVSLWQLGLVYADAGGPLTQALLERVPLRSEHKAEKVIQAAAERGLDHVAMSACRVMGRRLLQEEQLGAAIWWGVKSRDAAFTSHLAHKILQKYADEGLFGSTSLLDHLGPAMFISDALLFLSKYREFFVLYQRGNLTEAASLLASLVASRLAPEYFWPVILEDALPLLQSPTQLFSTEQTFKLMYCLHNITIGAADSEASRDRKKRLYASFLEKEPEVRRALTDNLARAIIREGTAAAASAPGKHHS